MTKKQLEFLKAIYNEGKTAKKLCQELKVTPYKNDLFAGHYNALNSHIDYLISDDKGEIDDMFEIIPFDGPESNEDIYIISQSGKTYIENHKEDSKRYRTQSILTLIAIIVAIIGVIIAFFQLAS
ncbi:hypothetical protein EUAN_08350 [Andreesenia angusta]|uniref:Uncharacterized protein n=1 Tax=Andreesenia angusta TaxID=39480 RepID=A0A1S1V8V8_9FIRM|nr:hypothetical protein [Andreesenia angusta]OHW63051.1 hypothetical protein EUAN_08350 [Andreesenia angusta]